MEHLDLYIYLVLGGLYVLSRILKGSGKTMPPKAPSSPQTHAGDEADANQQPRRRKPFSFEDLMREFDQQFEEKVPQKEEPEPVKPVRKKEPKPEYVVGESPYATYEGTSLENMPTAESIGPVYAKEFARNEHYARKEVIVSEYIKMLREPNGARNAIVLGEIINRKYF